MGKDKGRSKFSPAASSKAADFLEQQQPSTFGFGGSSSSLGFASLTLDESANVDQELKFVLKKLGKRDPTTKGRALEELLAMMLEKSNLVNDLITVWEPFFNKLVLDVDRKVRSLTLQIHLVITKSASKQLAPILKKIIGSWIVAQFDSSKDVSNLAKESFATAFPKKAEQALLFCHAELIAFLSNTILVQTPESLSDARYTTPEDMITKHARTVSGCFDALSFIMQTLSLSNRQTQSAAYQGLFSEKKFWAHASNDQILIRTSLFRFIKECCANAPDVVETSLPLISSQFLAKAFSEKNSEAYPYIWDAVLLLTKNFATCWDLASEKKPAINKFLSFLQNATYGSASHSYPCILPLVGHLPKSVKTLDFYRSFLVDFWNGHQKLDRFSSQVFLEAYYECSIYLLKDATEESVQAQILTQDFPRPLLQSLAGNVGKLSSQETVRLFLKYFDNGLKSNIIGKVDTETLLKSLLDHFSKAIENDQTNQNEIISLIQSLAKESSTGQDFIGNLVLGILEKALEYNKLKIISAVFEFNGLNLDSARLERVQKFALSYSPTGIVEDIVLVKCLLLLQTTFQQDGSVIWRNLMNSALNSPECWKLLKAIMDQLKGKSLNSSVFTPRFKFDLLVKNELVSCSDSENFADIVAVAMSLSLLDSETCNLVQTHVSESIQRFSQTTLRVNTAPVIESVDLQHCLFALYFLQFTLNDADCNSKLLDFIFLKTHFEALQLSICNPLTLGLKWTSSTINDIPASLLSVKEKSIHIVSLFDVASSKLSINSLVAHGSVLAKRWNASLEDLDHCASPFDFILILKSILNLNKDESFKLEIWKVIGESRDIWKARSLPFYSMQCPTMSLSDPFLVWTVFAEPCNLMEKETRYDHDGLCEYSRRALIFLSIFHDSSLDVPEDFNWLLEEIVRFSVVCKDSLFKEKPYPFADHAQEHSQQIENELDSLFSKILLPDGVEFLEKFQQRSSGHSVNVLLNAYIASTHETDNMQLKVSSSRVLAYLLKSRLSSSIPLASTLNDICLSLYADGKYHVISAFLLSIIPKLSGNVTGLEKFFSTIVKTALLCNSPAMDTQKVPIELFSVVLVSHLLLSLENTSMEGHLISNQTRSAMLRWIRTFYDAKVNCDDVSDQNADDSSVSVMFNAEIARLLSLLLKDIIDQEADIGLNMAKFGADLSIYWFKQIQKCSDLTPELACLLHHNIKFWTYLQEAADFDAESWQRVVDVEEEVEEILLDLFFVICQPEKLTSAGYSVLLDLMSDFVMELNPDDFLREIVANETKLLSMYYTPIDQVPKAAYFLMKTLTAKRVQDLSLSVEMESTNLDLIKIKGPLVDAICRKDIKGRLLFGHLLSWMSLADLFVDSTFSLRQCYTNHLRELDILGPFLEMIFDLVNVDPKGGETFNLSQWDIEEYLVEGFDSSTDTSIPLLCAHIYFRLLKSLPTLVRLWFSECRNRQLVLAVESFTEKYFSPLLLGSEFKATQALTDDSMSVKINPKTHDVTAAYVFEEAELDIVIRLPSCFPLKLIEVSSGAGGGRQAGINDARWRGWLLAISSVMIGHNGSVADALSLFKKNVSMHFEGIEDCAICYSVISLADRSTPQKPCRVCKHVFHGSCLFKWFKSSNSNLCPLCRQPI